MNIALQFSALFSAQGLLILLVLSALEVVLSIDNLIFISLVVEKLPPQKRFSGRFMGLVWAFILRIVMLFVVLRLSKITATLFSVAQFKVSVQDILFFIGGLYLLFNTLYELRRHVSGKGKVKKVDNSPGVYRNVVIQIVLIDALFSIDSILTAVGLVQNLVIMVVAVAVGMAFILWVSNKTSTFINKYPGIKVLSLCFIMLVGLDMVVRVVHYTIPERYLYAALGFALVVELINIKAGKGKPKA